MFLPPPALVLPEHHFSFVLGRPRRKEFFVGTQVSVVISADGWSFLKNDKQSDLPDISADAIHFLRSDEQSNLNWEFECLHL
jgi:hypothetical protein